MQKLIAIFSASLIAVSAQAHENMVADSLGHLFAHSGELLGAMSVLMIIIMLSARLRKRIARLPAYRKHK